MGGRVQVRGRRLLMTSLLIQLCLLVIHAQAQSLFYGEGRVLAVDVVRGMVTLDHGPIAGLMPAMRMAFPVESMERLQGLQVGDRVRFSLQPRGSEWAIASLEPVNDPSPPRPVLFPAPDFDLPTLSGETIRLADLRGKVVLLNFWATWCVPCRTEMPVLETLYQRYRDRGLEMLAVNMDRFSTAGVEAFLKEVEVTFGIVLDPSWATARAYRVFGLPTSYLIDRVGNVVVREVGERDWLDGVTRLALEGLLQEAGAAERR